MSRDSTFNTFLVAGSVCGICALLVSSAAVMLKSTQDYWVKVDTQKNILLAAAADDEERETFKTMTGDQINDFFKENFEDIIIDLETGEVVTDQYEDPADFDQIKAAELKQKDKFTPIAGSNDIAQIKNRENHSHVYRRIDSTERYIFPIRGKGLWSTLKGFIALRPDLETVSYITFYEHKETPGLGGEVDNAAWKARWDGKVVYDDQGNVAIKVIKGEAMESDPAFEYKIDGLSGATITSRGVQNMLVYWMGPEGYGNFIEQKKAGGDSALAAR